MPALLKRLLLQKHTSILFTSVVLMSGAASTHATDIIWDAACPNSTYVFSNTTCWTGGIAPGTGDTATFGQSSPYTVNFDGTYTNQAATITAGQQRSWDLLTNTYTLSNLTNSLALGVTAGTNGLLEISNGTVIAPQVQVATSGGDATLNLNAGSILQSTTANIGSASSTSDGIVNVAGGSWNNAGAMQLGFTSGSSARDQLNVSAGSVSVAADITIGASGKADLTGGAITAGGWTRLAGSGFNHDGGTLTVDGSLSGTGIFSSGSGNYVLSGFSAPTVQLQNGASAGGVNVTVNNGSLNLQSSSIYNLTGNLNLATVAATSANLSIAGGSSITSLRSRVGEASGANGVATVSGTGSSWINTEELQVGVNGSGALTIDNGATVTSAGYYDGADFRNAAIGITPGAVGSVTVSGADSRWTENGTSQGNLTVGGNVNDLFAGGDGSLHIADQALVENINAGTYIGYSYGSTGEVTVDNAQFDAGSFLDFHAGQGSLHVSNGGTVQSSGYIQSLNYVSSHTIVVDGIGSLLYAGSYLRQEGISSSLSATGGSTVNTGTYLQNSFSATMNVSGGSSVNTVTHLSNSGTMNISGGSTINTGTSLGNSGTMNISGGSTINTATTFSNTSSATTSLDGAGSAINVTGNFQDYSGTNGSFDITNGAALTAAEAQIRSNSTVDVSGAGASLTSNGALYLGGTDTVSSGDGTLNLAPGGIGSVAATLKLWDGGTLNLDGGELHLQALDLAGGTLNHNAGLLNYTQNLSIGNGGLYPSYTLNSQQALGVVGTATLEATGALTLNGGTFSAGSFTKTGAFTFNTGTLNLTASNFNVGTGGLFNDALDLASGQVINITQTTTVNADGILTLNNGRFSSGTLVNNGEIVLNGSASRLGGALTNNELLHGTGRVDASVTNAAGADIRAGNGETLRFKGASNTNAGRIEAIGGEIEFDASVANQAGTGNIVGRNAILRFNGGLNNDGSIGLSFGISDLFGDIVNDGQVTISGASNATFYDDYVNNGSTQVSTGSNAVFFGSVSGSGSYTGTGSVYFEGDLNPGNSPGLVSVAGDMNLGLASHTLIEIGGLLKGSEYDAFEVGGELSLDGQLEVALYDLGSGEFAPEIGDFFDLFTAENINGSFDVLTLTGLVGGKQWNLKLLTDAYNSTDVLRLTAAASSVPVPASALLFASSLGLLTIIRRRTAR